LSASLTPSSRNWGHIISYATDKSRRLAGRTHFTQANPQAASSGTGSGFASFLLGYPDAGSASQAPARALRDVYYAMFVQDSYRVSNRLTLNFGLRWDTESPQTERHGAENIGFNPNAAYTFAGQALTGQVLFPTSGLKSAYDWDKNNFGPRVGAAYHLTSSLLLRGGFGVLYSPTYDVPSAVGFSATTTYLASNNNLLTPAVPTTLSNPYPDGFAKAGGANANLNGMGGWTYWPNRVRNIPRTMQYSFGFEKQLPQRSILDMRYVGQLTDNIINSRNPNFLSTANLALGTQLNTTVKNPYAGLVPGTSMNGATIPYAQTLLPFPQYIGTTTSTAETSSAFVVSDTNGTTNYNGLQVRFEKPISANLHFLVSYTWAKSMVTGYLNNQDTALRHWIDHYNMPQILTISAGYSLPFFAHSSNGLVRQTLSGWSMNGIFSASSGEIYAAPTGLQATGVSPRTAHPTFAHEFNTCTITVSGVLQNCSAAEPNPVWSVNKPFTLNNMTPYYGGLTNPIPPSLNFSIFKSFVLYENMKLQFRAESFNLANTPQFGSPDTTYTDSTFGSRTNWAQINDPRNIQLALRLTF
jgi:hypothetical protein